MQEVQEDTRQRLAVDFRILSQKKKSSYRTARVKGFPVTETCEDFRKEVKNILTSDFSAAGSFSFGFIDKKHKKIWVLNDGDLADAYAAAINGQALWADPNALVVEEDGNKKGKKRSHDEMNAGASSSSPISEKIEDFLQKLKEKHGESHQTYQYRLWAEMLALGTHKSEEEPPSLPIFRNKPDKLTKKSSLSQVTTSKVETASPTASITASQACSSGYSRSDILQQLRELNELKVMGVLTEDEFSEKKKVLLNDLQ